MGWFRRTITILTLLAVATNAVAAGFRACCCTEPEQMPKHDCCAQEDSERPQVEPASCCAAKGATRAATTAEDSVSEYCVLALDEQPCCCIKSLPATLPAPRQILGAGMLLDIQDSLVCEALVLADFPAAKDRIRRCQPGMLVPAAPPPSILYGVWLN
jgi:hypothetical protein